MPADGWRSRHIRSLTKPRDDLSAGMQLRACPDRQMGGPLRRRGSNCAVVGAIPKSAH